MIGICERYVRISKCECFPGAALAEQGDNSRFAKTIYAVVRAHLHPVSSTRLQRLPRSDDYAGACPVWHIRGSSQVGYGT